MRPLLALISGIGSLVAQTTFTRTVGLGSVIVAMLVVILFGVFSFRDKRNSGWKDRYEQERATSSQEREKTDGLTDRLEAERIIRHDIKDELSETKALLEIEKSKPDLSVILERQQMLWAEQTAKTLDALQSMQDTQVEILALLRELKPAA